MSDILLANTQVLAMQQTLNDMHYVSSGLSLNLDGRTRADQCEIRQVVRNET